MMMMMKKIICGLNFAYYKYNNIPPFFFTCMQKIENSII